MKRLVILFFLILLTTITCSSQITLEKIKKDSIVLITPSQLKETNLIFAEHQKLLVENDLLLKQISNYKYDNYLLTKTDSLRKLQLSNYESLSKSYSTEIEKLNKEIDRKDKSILCWKIGGITVSVGLLIWLLLK